MGPMNYNKMPNTCVIRYLEGEEKEGGSKNILQEIMYENFPNLTKDGN